MTGYSIQLVPIKEYRNDNEYASGHKWDVIFEGETLLKASRNPEFEACRALVAKGSIWQTHDIPLRSSLYGARYREGREGDRQ